MKAAGGAWGTMLPSPRKQQGGRMSTQAGYGRRAGWITFAAMIMFAVGFLRIISAIRYFDDSADINNLTLGLFGSNLWTWGLWDLIIAALALFAGVSLLGGGTFGRVIGYIWGIFVIVQSFVIIGQAPWFAAAMIALASLVIYGLATTAGDEEGAL
jgi:hypothetical protein